MTVELPYKVLYPMYIQNHPYVSYGTFISLKPFYICGVTHNDIEMCCCKDHLHARWVVASIIESSKKNDIDINFTNYDEFFFTLN